LSEVASTSVSNLPIWLADAALASTARPPTTCRIIHIIVPGQPTKDRLAQQADQRV